eukprot:175634-Rhodomonas_salina.3
MEQDRTKGTEQNRTEQNRTEQNKRRTNIGSRRGGTDTKFFCSATLTPPSVFRCNSTSPCTFSVSGTSARAMSVPDTA